MPLVLELGAIHDPATRRAFEALILQIPGLVTTTGGGGGAPTGPAGGDLGSTYPNPTVVKAQSGFTVAGVAVVLSGDTVGGDLSGTLPNPQIAAGVIVNADINAAAAIAKSKLANLDVVNADVNAAAAIAETKLSLATDAAAGTGSRRTLGTGATQAAAGNDGRFTDARTPTAHHTTHEPGGADAMAVNAAAATGSLRTLGTTTTSAASGDRGMPTGGTTNQVLAKNTATNYDASWLTVTGGTPMRFGRVGSTGTITAGTGFTVSKTGTGVYVVTTSGFTITSAVASANAGGNQAASTSAFTTNTFTVNIFQANTAAAVDSAFSFVAV